MFFKLIFLWRRRTGLGPGGPTACLFPAFEKYGFLPGGFLDGSEFCVNRAQPGIFAQNRAQNRAFSTATLLAGRKFPYLTTPVLALAGENNQRGTLLAK